MTGTRNLIKKIIYISLMLLAIAGCQTAQQPAKQSETAGGGKPLGPEKLAERQIIPSSIGDTSTVRSTTMVGLQEKLGEVRSEYSETTGKYFGPQVWPEWVFAYSGTGVYGPGENIGITLNKLPAGRSARFQLTSRDGEMRRIALLADQTADEKTGPSRLNFSFQLPEAENAYYLLSAVILDEAGNVEDSFLNLFYVPVPEINARVTIDPVQPGADKAVLNLYNAGPTTLATGVAYSIQHKQGDQWMDVPLDLVFAAIGIHVKPGETFPLSLSLTYLEPGTYRAVISTGAVGTKLQEQLAAEFVIS